MILQNEAREGVTKTPSLQSGEAGIRTLGTLTGTPVFKTGAIGRSATSPAARFAEGILWNWEKMSTSWD